MSNIASYSDLVTAVTEYLAREQDTTLLARIPTFIQLAEAKLNRGLFVRQMEERATTAVDLGSAEPQMVSLPGDFQTMRRVRLVTVSGSPPVQFLPSEHLNEAREMRAGTTAQPVYYTLVGDELELCPTPDSAYTIEMVYRATIPPLTSTNTVNWLLQLAPDAYLYGALLESAPYIKEDERIKVWEAGLASAIERLNGVDNASTLNSAA